MATTITDSTITPKEMDFKIRHIDATAPAPRYKYVKVPLYNITSSFIKISPTTNTLQEFKLPTLVYNLARSYIEYNMNSPAEEGQRKITHTDVFSLGSTISFGAAGGLDLVNLQWAQNYSKIRRKIDTPLDEMLTNDETSRLYSCKKGATENLVPYARDDHPLGISFTGVVPYLENAYVKDFGENKLMDDYVRFPLGAFTGTMLGVDRNFYAGNQEMYLRINAGTGDKMGFSSDSFTKEVDDTAYPLDEITLNNVYLWLCVEENPSVIAKMQHTFNIGKMKYKIPYTAAFKMPCPSTGVVNHTIQLSQQYGKHLKRIMATVWNPQEKLHTAYDCNNFNGCKINNYRTWLNNIPLQDRNLSCSKPANGSINGDDWLENRKHLGKNSCILNRQHYALNWFHMDPFLEPRDKEHWLPEINVEEGLPMDRPHTYQFSADISPGGANSNFYFYAEFTREITVTPEGVAFIGQ